MVLTKEFRICMPMTVEEVIFLFYIVFIIINEIYKVCKCYI